MDTKYKCKDCKETFILTDKEECPSCKSLNIAKEIPMFFGMNAPIEAGNCEGGACTFDKK